MKKLIVFLIAFILLTSVNVYAKNLMVKVNDDGNIKTLEYYEDGELLSFKDARKKYNVSNYVTILYNDENLYFYQGNEVDETTYIDGINEEKVDRLIEKYEANGLRVKNTDELINTIKRLFDDRNAGVYHLVYSTSDLVNIDFKLVEDYVRNNYVFDSSINTFNYTNHGIIYYPKFIFNYDESEMVVNINPIISKQEEEYVRDFLKVFLNEFDNKTDYEKILLAYTYLNNTVSSCDGITKKGSSAYDALIKRNASCIGKSNTFQLIMESVGIESYIVENIEVEEEMLISSHTFNVVYFEENYYIIDLNNNSYEGFLMGNTNNYNLSNGKVISESAYNYSSLNINIDYNKYDKLVDSILIQSKKEVGLDKKNETLKNVDFVSYIVLIIILLFLTIVILYFTRKDR